VHVESFHLDGTMPVWRFAIGDLRVEQRVWMEPGANVTYVAWRLVAGGGTDRHRQLRISLLANGRDHHGETWMPAFAPTIHAAGERLDVTVEGRFSLHVTAAGGTVSERRDWVADFDLPMERERGLPARDSHLCVGEAEITLEAGHWTGIAASLGAPVAADLSAALERRLAHDRAVVGSSLDRLPALRGAPSWVHRLALAADAYVFARPLPDVPDGQSVIAGYPWFGDWGRDTMIALPGLTLATGRHDSARRILETFARFVDRGMLPNVFPGAGEHAEYNTVDAALWYVEAWRAYVQATGDEAALRRAFPVLESIMHWHERGTRYGIAIDPADGLLRAGEPGVQLTWMDAKIGDWVVTPRIGKPVEINALWYNALAAMACLAARLSWSAEPWQQRADRVRRSFRRFVRRDGGGLLDVLDGPEGDDATRRPNQILAVSLRSSPLAPEDQAAVLGACGASLLTSYGLRSLDPAHAAFVPVYAGGVRERDGAYHQGPVWAWLLGHYAMAHCRVHRDRAAAQGLLEPIADHLRDAALGQVSEIFDGAAPHRPRGAPVQAWSVASILEAWWRIEQGNL
jgi:4-alpha-glucanotransferase